MHVDSERAYGCLFCRTLKERTVAEQIEKDVPQVRAIVARREKYRTVSGRKSREEEILLPGYVFFNAPMGFSLQWDAARENVFRVLTDSEKNWQLRGEDERFARWLFHYNGLIGFSQAYQEGDWVRIVSGPLKDMEGKIKRVDKRGRSGQISMDFNGRTITMWLGFELIDPLQGPFGGLEEQDI